ncbi:unnamed protein product [marine sediment metagenome]|uniref:PQ loop repeat protein n=1 Tax=marine sediment metagenome TaxID=412755 RepID=X1IHH4_9ZZZZ
MIWQDFVISLTIILAGYALIPQVIHGFKVKKKLVTFQTSLIYVIAVYTAAIVFFTLSLYLSAIVNLIMGSLWLIIFIQGVVYQRRQ